jgi:hypothetical protein
MADYDPNRDFRDPNRLNEMQTPNWEAERNANASWGWILGGLAAVVLVLVALSFGRNDTQTASNVPPAAQTRPGIPTTGMNPPAARIPAQPSTTGQAPTQPSTTGQAPQQ